MAAATFLWVTHTQEVKLRRAGVTHPHIVHMGVLAMGKWMDCCHHKLQGVVCWVVMGDWDVFMHGMEWNGS